jgi:hypothetical protein
MEQSTNSSEIPVVHPQSVKQLAPEAKLMESGIPCTVAPSGVGDDTEDSVDLNGIVFDGASQRWLEQHGLMPNRWNLPATEAQRILSAQVRLFVFHSPVFVVDLKPNPFGLAFVGDLICFDANLLADASKGVASGPNLTSQEAIAFILHEIGHKLNKRKPPTDPVEHLMQNRQRGKYAVEEDADDYACRLGFGAQLADGLEKLMKRGLAHFESDANRHRVTRLRNTAGRASDSLRG